jgi:hypothetical protein
VSAVLSSCGKYRYRLDRSVAMEGGPTFMFLGVNPSTADATTDDATVRKWTGFVKRWGGNRFVVGNAFAYRATDVRELAKLQPADAIGLMNDWHIMQMAMEADVIVPCWGNTSKVPPNLRTRFPFLVEMLKGADKPVQFFGFTKSGDPLHPLMLGYDTPLCTKDPA